MKVMVIDVDDHDRVKLSRRRAMEELGLEDDLVSADEGESRTPGARRASAGRAR